MCPHTSGKAGDKGGRAEQATRRADSTADRETHNNTQHTMIHSTHSTHTTREQYTQY